MNIQTIILLFDRDLKRLKNEIEFYKNGNNLWIIDKSISISTGDLYLHLLGNLNAYVGLALGKIQYVRNRESELSGPAIPKVELVTKIECTLRVVETVLSRFPLEDLEKEFPMLVWE